MKVTEIEGKDVYGFAFLSAAIVLLFLVAGHVITTRSNVPTTVLVQPAVATPTVSVQTPAPTVNVQPSLAAVNVQVPTSPAPTVNVTTPPATVTVVNGGDKDVVKDANAKKEAPLNKEKMIPAVIPASIPVSVPAAEKKSSSEAKDLPNSREKQELEQALAAPTLDAVYKYAEYYLATYCSKHGLDPAAETKRWEKAWQARVNDNPDTTEQALLNSVVLTKRDSFKVDTATPEQIAEGCRILLRYRDANLAPPSQMQEAATPENLRKTIAALAVGVK